LTSIKKAIAKSATRWLGNRSHFHLLDFYKLTYQPAAISAWVIHPQNNDTRYQTIETIIQSAIKKQPANLIRRTS
jgi:hypothetical protein